MKLLDANPLIYSVDSSSEHHDVAAGWLNRALTGSETLLLPWMTALAFVRITTHPAVFRSPLDPASAVDIVRGWLSHPHVIAVEPDEHHLRRMAELLTAAGGRGGNLANDAHLAALALSWGATVITFDSDFGRFPDVRWERPA